MYFVICLSSHYTVLINVIEFLSFMPFHFSSILGFIVHIFRFIFFVLWAGKYEMSGILRVLPDMMRIFLDMYCATMLCVLWGRGVLSHSLTHTHTHLHSHMHSHSQKYHTEPPPPLHTHTPVQHWPYISGIYHANSLIRD